MADFQKGIEGLREVGAEVVALSVDSEENARKTVERHGLTYPVLYGLDGRSTAELLGAYLNQDPPYLHATGFVLKPDGTIALAVYSSGAIGRLTASDTLEMIKYTQKQG